MEIAPGVYSIKQLKGIFVQAFLIETESRLTLVDTLYDVDAKHILGQITKIGRTVQDLNHIVLTHAHRAHLGGLAALKAASGATVCCHAWEADIVAGDRKQQCMAFRPMRPYVLWPFQIGSLFGRHNPCRVDELIGEGDRVGPLQVVHTPGHTPGHLAFYHPEHRILFAGDALVSWPSFGPGWPGFMLNYRQERESIYKMAELEPQVLAVGHGDPITEDGAGRLKALVERIEREGLY